MDPRNICHTIIKGIVIDSTILDIECVCFPQFFVLVDNFFLGNKET